MFAADIVTSDIRTILNTFQDPAYLVATSHK